MDETDERSVRRKIEDAFQTYPNDKGQVTIPIEERKKWDGLCKGDVVWMRIVHVVRRGLPLNPPKSKIPKSQLRINQIDGRAEGGKNKTDSEDVR